MDMLLLASEAPAKFARSCLEQVFKPRAMHALIKQALTTRRQWLLRHHFGLPAIIPDGPEPGFLAGR